MRGLKSASIVAVSKEINKDRYTYDKDILCRNRAK